MNAWSLAVDWQAPHPLNHHHAANVRVVALPGDVLAHGEDAREADLQVFQHHGQTLARGQVGLGQDMV